MTITLPARPRVHSSGLREVAARMDELPEYYVEIIQGVLSLSPTPSKKHNGVVLAVQRQFLQQLAEDRQPHPVSSVEAADGGADYSSPDLIVVPAGQDEEEGWLYPANVVDFALEVVSVGNPANDTLVKPRVFAGWGIPIYLLVDPRDGTMVLHFDPVEGEYQAQHRMRFGNTVVLPEPLKEIRIETGNFPRYEH